MLGDIIVNSCSQEEVAEFLEKSVETCKGFVDHHYEGIRKAAIGTLWRSYQRVWRLMEEETGTKWDPASRHKPSPTPLLQNLGQLVVQSTLEQWLDEDDR